MDTAIYITLGVVVLGGGGGFLAYMYFKKKPNKDVVVASSGCGIGSTKEGALRDASKRDAAQRALNELNNKPRSLLGNMFDPLMLGPLKKRLEQEASCN